MTERAQAFMNAIWEANKSGADTEEKLVAAILSLATQSVKAYTAQMGLTVLDVNDMLQLAEELTQ
jgi:hypothetical protein